MARPEERMKEMERMRLLEEVKKRVGRDWKNVGKELEEISKK